jgi:ElaA protein
MSRIAWRSIPFAALTVAELYDALQLRSEVFVMEQAGIYQDMDGSDHEAVHVFGAANGQLVAYARCFAAGVKFAEASIGRVIIREAMRGGGMGHELMRQAIACVFEHSGVQTIRIGAQARLEKFYVQHGFVKAGEPYIEDGIPHVEMLRAV